MAQTGVVQDVELVTALVLSGAYCTACIARQAMITPDRVTAAFRQMELDWGEPLIDTAECRSCHATTTVYSLAIP
jgi:hypothetical protein